MKDEVTRALAGGRIAASDMVSDAERRMDSPNKTMSAANTEPPTKKEDAVVSSVPPVTVPVPEAL